ncbi:glycine cleavage system aminomethyltransferase GcvT [Bryobacter aggregatus]|uniref:glycine cleavage system aminomethyltransferase GcvT n=1 Tax=Bryobacter aggregatus TaxID=360054 RepID=UPI0004E18D61|nr:glycine cleavage system aminomethyltransferase GcvT [Bryobacter aggregatus]
MSDSAALLTTPLNATHRRLGAKMVDFGGWDMPVQYKGILDEHRAVRTGVGVFDVSHMGELVIRGPQALDLVNWIATNDASKLKTGQVQYSALLYEHGGFVDDILVHKVSDDEYFICVNASNQEKDFDHIAAEDHFQATVENAGARYAQIAIQGPKAVELCQRLTTTLLEPIRYYWFTDGEFAGVPARIARTGYTGEDGFEVYVSPEDASTVWDAVCSLGAQPCGLGARNTLRLEAKMALYGHEIDATLSPFEADLAWMVKMDKPNFIGKRALEKQKAAGIHRKLVGFEMVGRGIGRDGYEIEIDGEKAGWVTSGGPAPTLGKNIGLCYLPIAHAVPGQKINVIIRGVGVEAVTVPTPFYKRAK